MAWRDGKFCRRDELSINVQDFGLLHADGAYDTIYVTQGRAFMLSESWHRFSSSILRFRIPVDMDLQTMKRITKQLLEHSVDPNADCIVTVVVTRGIPETIKELGTCRPSICLFLKPVPVKFSRGEARACVAKHVQRVPDVCIDQSYKHFAWADLTMAQFEALDRGFDLGICASTDGYISEAFAAGICCYRDAVIYSPARNRVNSVTITALERAAENNGWKFQYTNLTSQDFLRADGMIACSIAGLCTKVSEFEHRVFDIHLDMSDKFNKWIISTEKFFTPIL